MRNLLLATGLVVLTLCLVSSAPQSAFADTALGTSTWSLELGTDLGAGNNDYSFAIRRHSGASSAFRLGIETNIQKDKGDGTRTETGSPDKGETLFYESGTRTFSIQWMRFAAIRDNVTATFALGPAVSILRSAQRQESGPGTTGFDGYEYGQKSTKYGLNLGLGVEWFFNPRLSLGGQSGIRAMTGTTKQISIIRSGTGATYSKTESVYELDSTELTTAVGRIQLTGYF